MTVHLEKLLKYINLFSSSLLPALESPDRELDLSDLDRDVAHIIVHFIYSGQYESGMWSSTTSDYLEAMRVNSAALRFGIKDLAVLAKEKIERLAGQMEALKALRLTKEALSQLPNDDAWMPGHVDGLLRRAIQAGGLRGWDMKAIFDHANPFYWTIFQGLAKQLENRETQLTAAKERVTELENAIAAEPAEEVFSQSEMLPLYQSGRRSASEDPVPQPTHPNRCSWHLGPYP